MKIEAKDFPLYELLLRLNQPGVENAKQGFADAQTGSDDKKYSFALGLSGLANTPGIEEGLTGFNPRMRDQTLRKYLGATGLLRRRGDVGVKVAVADMTDDASRQPHLLQLRLGEAQ